MNNLSEIDRGELKEWLKGLLRETEVTVIFEKKDGTMRTMLCTLKDVPPYERKTETVRTASEDVLAVFDVELSEWRSFRIDSVREIRFDLERP
jgi:hypothetical protein